MISGIRVTCSMSHSNKCSHKYPKLDLYPAPTPGGRHVQIKIKINNIHSNQTGLFWGTLIH